MAEDLKAAGLEFDTDVIASPGLRQIFSARDPGSGMMYEFIERMGGDFSDDSVKSLFRAAGEEGDVLDVNFQEVVHSVRTGTLMLQHRSDSRRTEWTPHKNARLTAQRSRGHGPNGGWTMD